MRKMKWVNDKSNWVKLATQDILAALGKRDTPGLQLVNLDSRYIVQRTDDRNTNTNANTNSNTNSNTNTNTNTNQVWSMGRWKLIWAEFLSQMVGILSLWGSRGPRGGEDDDDQVYDDHGDNNDDYNGDPLYRVWWVHEQVILTLMTLTISGGWGSRCELHGWRNNSTFGRTLFVIRFDRMIILVILITLMITSMNTLTTLMIILMFI